MRGKRWRAVKHKPQYQPKFMSMYLPKHHRINPVRGLVTRENTSPRVQTDTVELSTGALDLQILVEAIRAALAPDTGLLDATKRLHTRRGRPVVTRGGDTVARTENAWGWLDFVSQRYAYGHTADSQDIIPSLMPTMPNSSFSPNVQARFKSFV